MARLARGRTAIWLCSALAVACGGSSSSERSMDLPDDALGDLIPGYGLYGSIVSTLDTVGVDSGAFQLCSVVGSEDICK